MLTQTYFILDFDSTLVRGETLERLAELALHDAPDRDRTIATIKALTDQAMNGELDFHAALVERLKLLKVERDALTALAEEFKSEITPSFARNRAFLAEHAERIFIVTSGFREVVEPVVETLGIKAENVYANTLVFDDNGTLSGCDAANPLAHDGGKAAVAASLGLDGTVVVVGDGWSDYEIQTAGHAARFYAFTENVTRAKVVEQAERVAPSFDEVLYDCGFRGALSYPKNRLKVVLFENIHAGAKTAFEQDGYPVETVSGSLDEDALIERIADASIIGIRSKTHITPRVLAAAKRLLAVGAFCIGTNQIDLAACSRHGVAVFNAPFSNTRSVVELALAEIVFLMRNLPAKLRTMDRGTWSKSAQGSFEVRGKRLGIIGYGNIGMQLSVLAEAAGMDVCFYDVSEQLAMGTARKCASLEELLEISDAVTVHVDGRAENKNLIGAAEFARMKPGAVFLNLSRGYVVDLDALGEALRSGHIQGAAIDVYPEEPRAKGEPFEHPLREHQNVLLTPHIGGSTAEAQQDIGRFVSSRLIDYVNTGSTETSVNFPPLRLPPQADAHRLIHAHENVPGILAQINQVLAAHKTNIMGQYLKTNEQIGYVITDIDKHYSESMITEIREIPATLRFRVLY
jgi:D-3-phosphoglycerate dehydrogenase